MRNIVVIILLIGLGTSCVQKKNDIVGTWLNSDFSYPRTLSFGDSLWISTQTIYWDSMPYYLQHDSIFFQSHFSRDLVKYGYRISCDTLWTLFAGESKTYITKYFRAKSDHFIDDIKFHLGTDFNLPKSYSNLVGLRLRNSIYLPKQKATNNKYKLFLNDKVLSLDTLLHEKLFNLHEKDETIYNSVFGLYIDSQIKYEYVRLLKNELRKVSYYKIAFICDPSKTKYYESNIGILKRLRPIFNDEDYYVNPIIRESVNKKRPPNPPRVLYDKPDYNESNVCKVEIINNQVFLNDSIFDLKSYYTKLKKSNPLVTYFYVDDNSDYQTYYTFISQHDSLHQQIRNEKSLELYQTEYEKLIDSKKIKNINKDTRTGLIEQ